MVKSSAIIDIFTGEIYVGRGHGYIQILSIALFQAPENHPDCCGFIDENNEYLSREEAMIEAIKCNQIEFTNYERLFSEDIWEQIPNVFYKLSATKKSLGIAKTCKGEYLESDFITNEGTHEFFKKELETDEYLKGIQIIKEN